jgi:hypothetical protein
MHCAKKMQYDLANALRVRIIYNFFTNFYLTKFI